MNRLLLFMLLTYIVLTTESYINQDKKVQRIDLILPTKRKVNTVVLHRDYVLISLDRCRLGKTRMIELDNSNKKSNEMLTLHVPNRQRRAIDNQEKSNFCTKDEDCGPKAVCFADLICVGTWRTLNSLETNTAN